MRRSMPTSVQKVLVAVAGLLLTGSMPSVDAQASITPSATTAQVAGLSNMLSPSYAGMGFEPSNLFAFTGTASPNRMTMQLLQNLADYTGVPPHIRVGGNTGDTAVFQSDHSGYYFQPNPAQTGPTDAFTYGPDFFKVINYFPKGTPITYGLPLAYQGSNATDTAVEIAAGVVDAFTNVKLFSLEVGNEPDLYVQNKFRQQGWGASNYGQEWIDVVKAVYTQVLKPKGITDTFFEAACTATTAANRGFRIEDLVQTGVATDNGIWLAGWNQHDYYYYVNVSNYKLTLEGLMDLGSTEGQFTEWADQAGQANVTGKPYYLREMGSIGPEGIQGISDTFGNTLWSFNFFLYAATVGVQSVQLHMLQYSYGSAWQPIPDQNGNGPYVRSSYYAWAAIAQVIGAQCQTQVAPLSISNIPSGYNNRLGSYAVYNAGKLQSLVIINTKPAYSSQNGNINTQQVTFNIPSLAGQTFYLSLLTAPGADATTNTQWNGFTYEQTANGSPRKVDNQTRQASVGSDGTLTITVRDSQAVVANLGSVLGTANNQPDPKACNLFTQPPTKNTGSGFKATSGFAGHLPLSLGAIIGIAAGGGAALLIVLALCIWCCVRRSRRRAAQTSDAAALLPPSYKSSTRGGSGLGGGKRQPYNTLPINDMADSADDIFMMPVRGNGKSGGGMRESNSYNNIGGVGAGGGAFKGHKHTDSYGSATPSLTNSPLLPASPNHNSRARVESYSSHDTALPPQAAGYGTPTRSGSPKPTSRMRGAAPGIPAAGMPSNLNPNSVSRNGQPQQQMQDPSKRRSTQQQQQNNPWQQLAQQQQQQQGHPQGRGADPRMRFDSTPANVPSQQHSDAAAAAAAAAAAGGALGMTAAQQQRGNDARRNSLPSNRNSSPSRRAPKPSGAASSQGHGYRDSRNFDLSPRPPVPNLPESVRAAARDGGSGQRLSQQPRGNDSNSAALAAATAAVGGTAAAQRAYISQRQQQQQHKERGRGALAAGDNLGYGGMDGSHDMPQYGMAITTPAYDDAQAYQAHASSQQANIALLDPNAYAMAAQPRSSSEMAFFNQADPAGAGAAAYGPHGGTDNMQYSRSHAGHGSHDGISGPRPQRRSLQQPRTMPPPPQQQRPGQPPRSYESYGPEHYQKQ